jgi:hypothetical protein
MMIASKTKDEKKKRTNTLYNIHIHTYIRIYTLTCYYIYGQPYNNRIGGEERNEYAHIVSRITGVYSMIDRGIAMSSAHPLG